MFFHGWESLLRVSVSAAIVYLVIVAALRVFGQQSLAKRSGFDLVVSVAQVDEGPTMKRWRPRAQGRATRINKRTSHITLVVQPADVVKGSKK